MFPFVQYVLSCRCSVQQYVRWISCLLGRSWHHQRRCLSHLSRKSSHHRHNSLTAIYQKSYSARLHHNGVESSRVQLRLKDSFLLYLWQAIFTVTIGSFGFFNVSKTMLLQAVTTLVRWAGALIFFIVFFFTNHFSILSEWIEMNSVPTDDRAGLHTAGEVLVGRAWPPGGGQIGRNPESVRSVYLLFHVSPFTSIVGDSDFAQATHLPAVYFRLRHCRRILPAAGLHRNLRLPSAQWSLHVELYSGPLFVAQWFHRHPPLFFWCGWNRIKTHFREIWSIRCGRASRRLLPYSWNNSWEIVIELFSFHKIGYN